MLTDVQIKKAKPKEKNYKLTDSGGLYLLVSKSGSKLWRYRYQLDGREHLEALGSYPEVSLVEAREKRDARRKLVRFGGLVSGGAATEIVSNNLPPFKEIAIEWHNLQKTMWSDGHGDDVIGSLKEHVFPYIGDKSMYSISANDVLTLLRRIEARPAIETAKRVRQRISAVFLYAISSSRADSDPAAIVKGALAPLRKGKQPAVITLKQAREVITAVEAEAAHPVTKLAMRFIALTVVRPGTLATTPWSELENVNEDNPVWQIPAQRMKLRLEHKDDEASDHLVPLSAQALDVLEALKVETKGAPYVFPNSRHRFKPMSENALGYLLNRAGYHHRHVPHGWRATFSTIMNEKFPKDRFVIDLMLAHRSKDKVEAAYNRALYLDRRIELAQLWADMLLKDMKPPIELLTGPKRTAKKLD